MIDEQQSKINQLSNEVSKQKTDLDLYVHELKVLKSFASRIFRTPSSPDQVNSLGFGDLNLRDNDEISRYKICFGFEKIDYGKFAIERPGGKQFLATHNF